MTKELVVSEEPIEAEVVVQQVGVVPVRSPEEVVATASRVATALAAVIKERRLYREISGREYVFVDGWTTLGAMIGILPREVSVERMDDGGYLAVVELVRSSDLAVVGKASAVCGMDEKTWAGRPEYARRSMALTRATGKAYRLGFSWIMRLAGYEATPAEEMPDHDPEPTPAPVPPVQKKKVVGADDWANVLGPDDVEKLVERGVVPADAAFRHVVALMNLSPFKPGDAIDWTWFDAYRKFRGEGMKPEAAAHEASKR